MHRPTRARIVAGFAAIAALLVLVAVLPTWGGLRERAVVEAARTFSLTASGSGVYRWTLEDGRPARGGAILWERSLQTDRNELAELSLAEGLATGQRVHEGQVLASLRFPIQEHRLERYQARREALEAQLALLSAGARVEEVAAARKELELARARREGALPEIERVRRLAEEGAASQAELDAANLRDRVLELEVELAEARLAVARSSARPEALREVEAELAALDARIEEVRELVSQDLVTSPIDGVVEVGGGGAVFRVYDVDPVYLRIPVPEKDRLRVAVGARVTFSTPSSRGRFEGKLVDVAEDASTLAGRRVFWASAELPNPGGQLRSGMAGVARIALDHGTGLGAWLWYELVGY